MDNNNSRLGAPNADQIAQQFLEIVGNHISQGSGDTSANTPHDSIMHICKLLETVQLFIQMMQTQDMGPRFRFMSTLTVVALGLVRFGLWMWIQYGDDMPWLTSVLSALVLFLLILRIRGW